MANGDTRALIDQALVRLGDEVPALKQVRLVIRLELPARADAAVWRIELPQRKIARDPAADARVDVSIPRSHFNELAAKGRLRDWVDAYERGHVRASGEPALTRLVGSVLQRTLSRAH